MFGLGKFGLRKFGGGNTEIVDPRFTKIDIFCKKFKNHTCYRKLMFEMKKLERGNHKCLLRSTYSLLALLRM